jgi:hypothetical protein
MTLVRGPNLDLVITDRAMSALGAPGSVLPRVWTLLEQHGRRRTPAEYEFGGTVLRIMAGRAPGALVIGVVGLDFADKAA